MKIKIFPAMLAVAVFCTAACDKDDDKDDNTDVNESNQTETEVEVTAASAVAGIYNGNLSLEVMGADQGTEATSVTLVAADDDTVTLTLSGFEAMGADLGDIVIEEVSVAKSGDAYSISAEQFQSLGVPYGESTVNISGSLEGECDGKDLSATFTLTLGAMPFPVTGYFTTVADKDDNTEVNDPDQTEAEVEVTAASAVAGIYNGNLTLEVMGAGQGTEATSVTLVAADGDTVTLTLGGFEAMGTDLSDIVIEGVGVAKSGESYSISADEFQSLGVPYGASTVNISGSLEGECDGENLSATFTLNLGAMPFPVTAYFTTVAE